ncbi:MAG: putative lipid II flippase FtsW [Candidatus Omnitrophica bacterium]|nr:putative lipid II flippase FtsW [Candidatus Omnitrophota bacterium]
MDRVKALRQDIVMIVLILISFGCIMIYSSSSIFAYEHAGDSMYFLKRQLLAIALGGAVAFLILGIRIETLKKRTKPFFLVSLFLLMLVFLPPVAKEIGGAKRWLRLGLFGFQPSECMKLALALYLAELLSRKGSHINDLKKGLLVPACALLFMLGLVLLEPDLGRVIELSLLIGVMFFLGGIRSSYLVGSFLSSLPVFYFAIWRIPFRRARVLTFLNPWADPQGSGFQIIQSYLALGSGGMTGVGLGAGLQKLFYLPEAYTDFIFAIIGEECGLIGTLCILALFVLLFYKCFRLARGIKDRFAFYLAFGITVMLAFEVLVNIGAISGSIPTKGLPLPFISYGGSALLANMAGIGLLLNVSRDVE